MDQVPFEFNVVMFIDDYYEMIEQFKKNPKTKWLVKEAEKQLNKQIENI